MITAGAALASWDRKVLELLTHFCYVTGHFQIELCHMNRVGMNGIHRDQFVSEWEAGRGEVLLGITLGYVSQPLVKG